ncbi:uncharacterized protein LOC108950954 [Ciona intestinalis]
MLPDILKPFAMLNYFVGTSLLLAVCDTVEGFPASASIGPITIIQKDSRPPILIDKSNQIINQVNEEFSADFDDFTSPQTTDTSDVYLTTFHAIEVTTKASSKPTNSPTSVASIEQSTSSETGSAYSATEVTTQKINRHFNATLNIALLLNKTKEVKSEAYVASTLTTPTVSGVESRIKEIQTLTLGVPVTQTTATTTPTAPWTETTAAKTTPEDGIPQPTVTHTPASFTKVSATSPSILNLQNINSTFSLSTMKTVSTKFQTTFENATNTMPLHMNLPTITTTALNVSQFTTSAYWLTKSLQQTSKPPTQNIYITTNTTERPELFIKNFNKIETSAPNKNFTYAKYSSTTESAGISYKQPSTVAPIHGHETTKAMFQAANFTTHSPVFRNLLETSPTVSLVSETKRPTESYINTTEASWTTVRLATEVLNKSTAVATAGVQEHSSVGMATTQEYMHDTADATLAETTTQVDGNFKALTPTTSRTTLSQTAPMVHTTATNELLTSASSKTTTISVHELTTFQNSEKICDQVQSYLSKNFDNLERSHKNIIEQKVSVRFRLNDQVDITAWSLGYCKLSLAILETSETSLEDIIGLLRYSGPPRMEHGSVLVQIDFVVDYTTGLEHKTSLLYKTYADIVAARLNSMGYHFDISSLNVTEEVIETSSLCATVACTSNERCQVTNTVHERWVKCTSECSNTNYCLNNGICSLNHHRQQQCWCPSSDLWWFRGSRCEIAETKSAWILIAAGCLTGFVLVLLTVVLCLARRFTESKSTIPGMRRRPLSVHYVCFNFSFMETQLNSVENTATVSRATMATTDTQSSVNETDEQPINTRWVPERSTSHSVNQTDLRRDFREMVLATSFRSINSRERAEMSGLHGEAASGKHRNVIMPNNDVIQVVYFIHSQTVSVSPGRG